MPEGEELKAGFTAGAAGDDDLLVGGDAAADQNGPNILKGAELVGVLLRLVGVVRFGERLPVDVLRSGDVAVADEGLVGAFELGLGTRVDDHHVAAADQGLQFTEADGQALDRGGPETAGLEAGEGLGGALPSCLEAAEAAIDDRHLTCATLLEDVGDQGGAQHVVAAE